MPHSDLFASHLSVVFLNTPRPTAVRKAQPQASSVPTWHRICADLHTMLRCTAAIARIKSPGIRRAAAHLQRELQTNVDMVHGRYGELKVTVDADTVIDGGAAAFLGVVPSRARIVAEVKTRVLARAALIACDDYRPP